MANITLVADRLGRRLKWHQRLHQPESHPLNLSHWLPELRHWQAERLRKSFKHFLVDPKRKDAAEFFLSDLYGDRDFARRDADIVRVLPLMQKLLPTALLQTVTDAIELAAVTQALDLRMAGTLRTLAPARHRLDAALYAQAYREAGLPRLRRRQMTLIGRVGRGLGDALRNAGVRTLLKLSRTPARLAGFSELQMFLERGFDAYAHVENVEAFVAEIERSERLVSERLFAGDPRPFDTAPAAKTASRAAKAISRSVRTTRV